MADEDFVNHGASALGSLLDSRPIDYQGKYNDLQNKYNDLQSSYDSLASTANNLYAGLAAFSAAASLLLLILVVVYVLWNKKRTITALPIGPDSDGGDTSSEKKKRSPVLTFFVSLMLLGASEFVTTLCSAAISSSLFQTSGPVYVTLGLASILFILWFARLWGKRQISSLCLIGASIGVSLAVAIAIPLVIYLDWLRLGYL